MRKRRKSSDPGLLLGLAGALLLHGGWLLMPLPELRPREGFPLASIHLLSETPPWVWTPTIFSLPTRFGFSGAMYRDTSIVEPPLESPVDLSVSSWLHEEGPRPPPELPPPADTPAFGLLTPVPAESPAPTEPQVLRWSLVFPEQSLTPLSGFRPPQAPTLTRAVHLEGALEFDEFGMVSHVLLARNPLNDAERREVLRSLRSHRIPRGLPPARHNFRLSYLPEDSR